MHIGSAEDSDHIVTEMNGDDRGERAGGVKCHRKNEPREEVDEEALDIKVQKRKVERRKQNRGGRTALFVFRDKKSAEDEFLAERGEQSIGEDQIDSARHGAIVFRNEHAPEVVISIERRSACGIKLDKYRSRRQRNERGNEQEQMSGTKRGESEASEIKLERLDIKCGGQEKNDELQHYNGNVFVLAIQKSRIDQPADQEQNEYSENEKRRRVG